jgi:hypothetical protein
VLVVVHYRDVEAVVEAALDQEAARRGDILEVDAAEARGQLLDRLDDHIGVLRAQADRHSVDVGQLLKKDGLTLHHGHGRLGAEVAEAEDGTAVADHGHAVALPGQVEDLARLVGDGAADAGDARGVGERQVVAVLEGHLALHGQLAAQMGQEDPVAHVEDLDTAEGGHSLHHSLAMPLVLDADGDVAHEERTLGPDDIDRADIAAYLTDARGEPAEHAGAVLDLAAHGQGVGDTDRHRATSLEA